MELLGGHVEERTEVEAQGDRSAGQGVSFRCF